MGSCAQVHPYAKMAWSVLGSIPKVRLNMGYMQLSGLPMTGMDAAQALLAQIHRDERIRGLVDTMVDMYKFVLDADSLKYTTRSEDQSPSQKKIIEILAAMAAQTIECAYFIRAYAEKKSFCKQVFLATSIGPDNLVYVRDEGCEVSHH